MLKDKKSRTLGQLLLDYDGCDFIRIVNPFDIALYHGMARDIFNLADVDDLLSRYVNYYEKRMDGLGRMYIYIKLFINGENDEDENQIKFSNYYYGMDPIPHRNVPFYFHDLKIERVILRPPATIVFWSDGDKTVVKCNKDDIYDPEKGVLWAIAKKYTNGHPKTYDNYIQFIDNADDCLFEGIPCDGVEITKGKKEKYKRHFGDSSQTCPHCGGNWLWSNKRRLEYYTNGFIDIPCRHCGKTFRICK